MEKPRQYTVDEVREIFIRQIWTELEWWEKESRAPSLREKLEGLAFSMLVTLDGESACPGFHVVPCVAPEDKDYYISQGENWYPELPKEEAAKMCDIGGSLHEVFHSLNPNGNKPTEWVQKLRCQICPKCRTVRSSENELYCKKCYPTKN
jgi:hypothetical protein